MPPPLLPPTTTPALPGSTGLLNGGLKNLGRGVAYAIPVAASVIADRRADQIHYDSDPKIQGLYKDLVDERAKFDALPPDQQFPKLHSTIGKLHGIRSQIEDKPLISGIPTTAGRLSSNAPLKAKGLAEGSNLVKKWLDADITSAATMFPGAAPVMGGLTAAMDYAGSDKSERSLGGSLVEGGGAVVPQALAGAVASKIPRFIAAAKPGMGGILRGGAGVAAADIANEVGQTAMGLDAPKDYLSDSPWRVGARSVMNMASGAAGGAVAGKNPWTALAGGVYGFTKEPRKIWDAHKQNKQLVKGMNESTNLSTLGQISDPSIPIERFGNGPGQISLEGISASDIDAAYTSRAENAKNLKQMPVVRPRSQGGKGRSAGDFLPDASINVEGRVNQEINDNKPISMGAAKTQSAGNPTNSIFPVMGVGGGILAAGAGLYALRKLFQKNKEKDKVKNFSNAMTPKIATYVHPLQSGTNRVAMPSWSQSFGDPNSPPQFTPGMANADLPSSSIPTPGMGNVNLPQSPIKPPAAEGASPPDWRANIPPMVPGKPQSYFDGLFGVTSQPSVSVPKPAPVAAPLPSPGTPSPALAATTPARSPAASAAAPAGPAAPAAPGGMDPSKIIHHKPPASPAFSGPKPPAVPAPTAATPPPAPVAPPPNPVVPPPAPVAPAPAAPVPSAPVVPAAPAPAPAPPAPTAPAPSGQWAMPPGATKMSGGWATPTHTPGGTKMVSYTPTSAQSLEASMPGYGSMSPGQRALALSKYPTRGQVGVDVPNPRANARGETRNIDGTIDVDPSKDMQRPHSQWVSPNQKEVMIDKKYLAPGSSGVGSVTFGAPAPTAAGGRIRDETGDVTSRIMGSLKSRKTGMLLCLEKTGIIIPHWIQA